MVIAIFLILLGLLVSFLDSLWIPRQAIYSNSSQHRQYYETPYLVLAVDPPSGLTPSDVKPQIDLTLDARLIGRDAIHGTLQVFYSQRALRAPDGAFEFGIVGPPSMKVKPGDGCDPPSTENGGVKFSSGICHTTQAADGFKFEIPHGEYAPSVPVGLARDRFTIEMLLYGYRGSGASTFIPESKFKPIQSYTLKFQLEKGTTEFAQSTPEPTFTEEYSRSWNVTAKQASRPYADFFSATIVHTFWNSILNWISNATFLGFGFFLGSVELKRRKTRENQAEAGSAVG
jgi:hypothetical protein